MYPTLWTHFLFFKKRKSKQPEDSRVSINDGDWGFLMEMFLTDLYFISILVCVEAALGPISGTLSDMTTPTPTPTPPCWL